METTLSQQMRHMSWLSTKHAKMAAALEEQLRKEDPDMAKMLRMATSPRSRPACRSSTE